MGPKGISIAVFCIGAAGCVSLAPPIDRLAASEASIRDANAAGAARITPASLYLTLADQEVEKARLLMAVGEHDLADLQLLRAQADAELARDLARENLSRGDSVVRENVVRENVARRNPPRVTAARGVAETTNATVPTDHPDRTDRVDPADAQSNVDALPKTGKP